MNHVVKKQQQQGFTLIELMLAMTFIAFLLVSIALTIIQVGAVYNKGTTLKEINQTSRDLNDDIRRNIRSSGSLNLATDYVLSPTTATPASAVGGRLCLGSYSYIWNYAKALAGPATDSNVVKYPAGSAKQGSIIRMVKVPDSARIYCAKDGVGALSYKDIRADNVAQAQEILEAGDHELGLHQLTITPAPTSAVNDSISQQMVSIVYTIGTSRISALNATQTACLPPEIANSDPLYCNVQQFSLVVRAGNGVN